MALRNIRVYGDPVLRKVADPVEEFGPDLKQLAEDMLETMLESDGVGLAAPQVGVSKRFVVIGIPVDDNGDQGKLHVFNMVNPEIIDEGEEIDLLEEGCLSLPEITVNVERPTKIVVEYQNLDGETIELEAEGMFAKVIQHEIDHLDGVLITDYLPPLKRTMMRNRLKKLSEQAKESSEK